MGKLPRFANDILTVYKDQLVEVLSDLPSWVDEEGLCKLISLDYSTEGECQSISYDMRAARLVYLMRYFHSYSHEYLMMYRDIFREMQPKNEVNICSIGCGALIDRWSAIRALGLKELGDWDRKTAVMYRGYDVQDWGTEAAELWAGADDGCATLDWSGGAEAFASDLESGACTPDIICFPKSAMEIRTDRRAWERVLGALRNFDGREVWIAVSRSQSRYDVPFFGNPNQGAKIGDAMHRIVEELSEAMCTAGFSAAEPHLCDISHHDKEDEIDPDDKRTYRRVTDGSSLNEEFDEELVDFMKSLHDYCPCWKDDICINPSIPEKDWKEMRGQGADARWIRGACKASDRTPAGVHAERRKFRACYAILHFKKVK